MSEVKNITAELRGSVGRYCSPHSEDLYISESAFASKCDSIDAIHDNLCAENRELRDEVNWLHAELQAWEDEGVKLPLDADGVPIRVGDVMDGYGKTIEVVELRHGRSGWVLISRDGNGYADTFAFTHHRAPTVEDVIVEYAEKFHNAKMMLEAFDYDALRREYAAKLREVMAHERD